MAAAAYVEIDVRGGNFEVGEITYLDADGNPVQ